MKRLFAWVLSLWLLGAAFAVSAESTTADKGGNVTQTTSVYEQVEVLEKMTSVFPDGTALAMIVLGGVMILLAIALLCVFLFGFPRWGLVKNPPVTREKEDDIPPTEDVSEEVPTQAPSVRLEDLF